MDNQNMVDLHHGILLANKKEQSIDTATWVNHKHIALNEKSYKVY